MEGTVNQRDPTSELSAYLIHEILNLLPTRDAARTSVLSKAWKTAWDSFPYLDFDQENFPDYNGFSLPDDIDSNNFIEFIDSTMEKLQNRDLKIFKFRLFIDLKDVKKASPFFDQWMSFNSSWCEIVDLLKKFETSLEDLKMVIYLAIEKIGVSAILLEDLSLITLVSYEALKYLRYTTIIISKMSVTKLEEEILDCNYVAMSDLLIVSVS